MSPLAETTSLIQGLIDSWPRLARFFVATFLAFPFIIAGWDKGVQVGWIPDERERMMSELIMQHQTQILSQAEQTHILAENYKVMFDNQVTIKSAGDRTFQALLANCFIGAKNREDHQRCETLNRTGKGD